MKHYFIIASILIVATLQLKAQTGAEAGSWKTWFISSGKDYRLPAPVTNKNEIMQVIASQKKIDSAALQQINYWNTGSPGYRWQAMMSGLWMYDTSYKGALANMLLSVATYDATVAGWETKYTYKRQRPFVADNRVRVYTIKPTSPSYPCEYSIAAGVAVAIFHHFYPALKDSVSKMAQQLMDSRVAAGIAYPSDTKAGFELGKKIAALEIEHTKDYTTKTVWDRRLPEGEKIWKGKYPMFPLAGLNKTVVLTSGSEFRPGPPPDFTKEMQEMKNFKRTFRSNSNAFYYASQNSSGDLLDKKIFEYNIHLDPPRAARIYAITSIGYHDAFIACFDAKYAYWGIRPDQFDTTYSPLVPTPPFPGYPSGHAVMSGLIAELFSYFFPAERKLFEKVAKDGAESRFQAGIHFRTDNEVGLELGRKVAFRIIEKVKNDESALNSSKAKKIK